MPPKTRNAKKRVDGNDDTDTDESAVLPVVDPNLIMMQQMMETMQEQMRLSEARAERREEQMRIDAREDRERMKAFMTDIMKRSEGNVPRGPRSTPGDGVNMRSKRLDAPVLGPVESVTMADFRTWRDHFEGYANVLRLKTECDLTGRRTMLRSALDSSWSKLWTTQMLKILPDDDIEQILDHIRAYIRKQRNPVLDRRDFYRRSQRTQEKIDQFYADVKDIYESCEFGHEDLKCENCGELCGHGKMLREEFLRDKLLFGMLSEKHQEKVLEIPLQDLTLEKTHTLIQAMESSVSTTTELRSQDVSVDAVRSKKGRWKEKSTYKQEKIKAMSSREGCRNCGKRHEFGECPAANRTCNYCHRTGHYEICCWAKEKEDEEMERSEKEVNMTTMGTACVNLVRYEMKTRPVLNVQSKIGVKKSSVSRRVQAKQIPTGAPEGGKEVEEIVKADVFEDLESGPREKTRRARRILTNWPKHGEKVLVQHKVTKQWDLMAEVVQIRPRKRNCLVRSETGKLYWRNRRFLRLFVGDERFTFSQQQVPKDEELNWRSSRKKSKDGLSKPERVPGWPGRA